MPPPISFILMWSPEYLVWNIDHKAHHYVFFPTSLFPRLSWAQISFSAPYSWTHSAYVLPSMWRIKFHIHNKQTGKITVPYVLFFIFLSSKPEDKGFWMNDSKHYLNKSSNKTVTLNWELPRLFCGQTVPLISISTFCRQRYYRTTQT